MNRDSSAPRWDSVKFYFSGDDYFEDVLSEILKARREILVESYIFVFDRCGLQIMDALAAAHSRGVEVKILVDGIGSIENLVKISEFTQTHHIPFRVFHPPPFRQGFARALSWRYLGRALSYFFSRINKRNHRKMFCIDDQHLFVGSANICESHCAQYVGRRAWRDTGVRLEGSELQIARQSFLEIWSRSKRRLLTRVEEILRERLVRRKSKLGTLVRTNLGFRERRLYLKDLQRRIENANKQIFITNAYFVPPRSILRRLKKMARSGVPVQICLPAQSDVAIVQWASRSIYKVLIQAGIEIYEYLPSMLHAKSMIVDEQGSVGSFNFNHRSIIHDLEIEIVLNNHAQVQQLKAQWNRDLKVSKPITDATIAQWNPFLLLFGRFIYIFRYWL